VLGAIGRGWIGVDFALLLNPPFLIYSIEFKVFVVIFESCFDLDIFFVNLIFNFKLISYMKNLTLKLQILFLTQLKIKKNRILLFFVIFLSISYSYGQSGASGYFTTLPTLEKLCTTSNNDIFLLLPTSSSAALVYNLTLSTQIQIGSTTSNNFLTLNPAPDCFAAGGVSSDILLISNVVANNVFVGNLTVKPISSAPGAYNIRNLTPKLPWLFMLKG